jgi:hypothetical protein
VRLLERETGKELAPLDLEPTGDRVVDLEFAADGKRLFVASARGEVLELRVLPP